MSSQQARRRFGWIRKLPSGRYQASYLGPDGQRRNAPQTFTAKGEAGRWLTMVESEIIRGSWTDPERGKMRLDEYSRRWIDQRPGLRPRTVDLYRWLFSKYLATQLGRVRLIDLDPPLVRQWRHDLLTGGVSPSMAAKAYRLLRAILNTAVEDGFIPKNPCRIKGGGSESPAERPTLTVPQVLDLAGRMPARYRLLVLLTVFGSLRWGEVSALRRRDVDPGSGRVTVRAAFSERSTGELVLGPPKSTAGVRTLTVPAPVAAAMRLHLDEFVGVGEDAWLFTGVQGRPVRRSNFNKSVKWAEVVRVMGLEGLHFHDLRHTGNLLAAQTPGATLRDLMARMGHDSMRAALIYQHASRDADRHIAESMGEQLALFWPVTSDDDDDDEGGSASLVPTA
jgi:integrase